VHTYLMAQMVLARGVHWSRIVGRPEQGFAGG